MSGGDELQRRGSLWYEPTTMAPRSFMQRTSRASALLAGMVLACGGCLLGREGFPEGVEGEEPVTGPRVQLGFSETTYNVVENAGLADLNVTMSREAPNELRIAVAIGGTAVRGDDYDVPSEVLVIPRGATAGVYTIEILNDAVVESLETIDLQLEAVLSGHATIGTPAGMVLSIVDDD